MATPDSADTSATAGTDDVVDAGGAALGIEVLDRVAEPVSAALRDAKARARATHYTVGTVQGDPDGTLWLECSCGTALRNGPTWTLDEHVRLHRAEAKYLELSASAPPEIPRLIEI